MDKEQLYPPAYWRDYKSVIQKEYLKAEVFYSTLGMGTVAEMEVYTVR